MLQADGWVATSSEGGAIIAQKDGRQLLQSTGGAHVGGAHVGGAGCGLLFPKVKPGHPTVTTVLVSGSSQVRPMYSSSSADLIAHWLMRVRPGHPAGVRAGQEAGGEEAGD